MEIRKNTNQRGGPRKTGPGGAPDFKGGPRRGGRPGDRPQFEREKSEFDQKTLLVRRVTRVVSGGRKMSFAVVVALGDKKGSIGIGTGKGADTAIAIQKAARDAKKRMITVKTTKNGSIPFGVSSKYSSARIMIMPNGGKGNVCGSAVRDIIILGGIKDVTSKIFSGSKNKLNIARATIEALKEVSTPYKAKKEAPKVEAFAMPEEVK